MINNNGLTSKEVIQSRKKYGSNIITKKDNDTFLKLLLETLSDPIIKILLIALAIKTIFLFKDFDFFETIGIVLAILVASLISSLSEYGSMRAFNKLTEENAKVNVKVKRNGIVSEIKLDEVVKNDIIILSSGDKIPADGIIISGNITVDESMMNGETKEANKISTNNFNNISKENKVYMSTVVYRGNANMLVTSVGDNTFYGKMAKELQEHKEDSPLKERLTVLAKNISRIGYIASFLVAISYLFNKVIIVNNFNLGLIMSTITNYNLMFSYLIEALTLCVTIIVVAVPEGLPMMITLVLSSNMNKMLKDNVLVRKLVGIETSGNINILFTDKTGTLTNGHLEVIGLLSGNTKEINLHNISSKYKNMILDSISINNESIYDKINNKIVGGNITDRALKEYIKEYVSNKKIIKQIPFSSDKKYMITQAEQINYIKGAPELIIEHSNYYYDELGIKHILRHKEEILNNIKNKSKGMIRIISLAISEEKNIDNINNLTLIGFVMFMDNIRNEAKEGIKLVKEAGIETIMITGDNEETAISIAKELNIIDNEEDIVITSDTMNKMKDEELSKILSKIRVISRAMPQDKSRLVNIAHSMNLVVGMTGDGVNDAIALKKADVGFAMGSGTEVAKEASDIVILDNNIKSIAKSILYGRTIFKSIRKFIICQLTINLCALSVSIIGPFIGIDTPITVIQMLWINMIMDTLSGLAFSYEPALLEYMQEPPKKRSENIINKYMISQILVTGLYSSMLCIYFLKSSFINNLYTKESKLTAFFGLLIFISIFNSLSARTYRLNILGNINKNKVFIGIILFITTIQIILLYYGGNLFRTYGLTIKEFTCMFLLSITVLPVDFIRKVYLKRKGESLGT